MVIARHLPSSNVLIVFQGVFEKQKWEVCPEVL